MANIYHDLKPEEAAYPTSNAAREKKIQGTNFPVTVVAFSPSAEQKAYWKLKAVNYGSGSANLKISWYADTASTGVVRWGARLAAVTPNTDTVDIETKALATQQTVDDTHLGTTGQRLHSVDLNVANLDSLASGDDVWLEISRLGAAAEDTLAGDVFLTIAEFTYSDT